MMKEIENLRLKLAQLDFGYTQDEIRATGDILIGSKDGTGKSWIVKGEQLRRVANTKERDIYDLFDDTFTQPALRKYSDVKEMELKDSQLASAYQEFIGK